MENSTTALSDGIRQALQALDYDWVHRRYWEQNECVLLEHVLPYELLVQYLLPEAEQLRADIHRNYLPRHKKGGSVSYYTVVEKAPALLTLYHHPLLLAFLSRLVGAPVIPCPDDDPHALCPLFLYRARRSHRVSL